MSKANRKVKEPGDLPIVVNVAFDTTLAIGLDNTYHNCVSSIYLPYSNEVNSMPLSTQGSLFNSHYIYDAIFGIGVGVICMIISIFLIRLIVSNMKDNFDLEQNQNQ